MSYFVSGTLSGSPSPESSVPGKKLEMSTVDRRAHQRQPADFFTVVRRFSLEGKPYLPEAGFSRDVSTGGIFFFVQARMEPGERVSLTFYPRTDSVKESTPPKLVASGKVIRVETAPSDALRGRVYGIAVKFDREPEVVFERNGVASIIRLFPHLPSSAYLRRIPRKSFASAK